MKKDYIEAQERLGATSKKQILINEFWVVCCLILMLFILNELLNGVNYAN
jgi:hypothetical protein